MKWQRKKTQIKNIVQSKQIQFQNPDDEMGLHYYTVEIDNDTAEKIAVEILEKFGYKQKQKSNGM